MNTYVVGHKNPDTDSVVSAIAVATLWGDTTAAVTGSINNETKFLLDRFKFETPVILPSDDKKVILVDNNGNPEELAEGINDGEIISIIDHHKLGGLKTSDPVDVRMEKVGSTATIISEIATVRNLNISREIASILIGAILSDTLKFTSPTTTDADRLAVEQLNKIANLDIEELADGMFAAKSDISSLSSEELIGKDYKVFEMNGKKVGIGVWETVLPEKIIERKEDILMALKAKKQSDKLDYILFASVDIIRSESDFYIIGDDEKEIVEAVFGGNVVESVINCPGVVSRKKQISPQLEKYLLAK